MRTAYKIYRLLRDDLPTQQINELYITFLKYPALFKIYNSLDKIKGFCNSQKNWKAGKSK
jgi:hypothetical protein